MLNEEEKSHEIFKIIVGCLFKEDTFFHSLYNSSHLLLIFKAHILIISTISSSALLWTKMLIGKQGFLANDIFL